MNEKAMRQLEHEILVVDISADGPTAEAEHAINEKLAQIDQKLEFYTSTASTFDYALATGAGILAGAVNALIERVAQADLAGKLSAKMDAVPTGADLLCRILPSDLDMDALPIQELVTRIRLILAQQAMMPSPEGLVATMALLMLDATSAPRHGSKVPAYLELHVAELLRLLPYAAIAGLMAWMQRVSLNDSQNEEKGWFPETLRTFTSIFNEYPAARQVVDSACAWFENMARQSVMKDSKPTHSTMSEAFLAFFQRLTQDVPELQKLDLTLVLAAVNADKLPLMTAANDLLERLELAPLEKQAMPVLLMEAIVRTSYFIKGLAGVLRSGQTRDSSTLQALVPFGNRTVERMITVASMSLAITNTAEAAICAAIESEGDPVMFSQKFVTHYNYVAAGRCAVAIVREAIAEQKELDLLRKRRRLTEEQAKLVQARIEAYKAALTERLDAYLAHDLEAFLTGFEQMDEGLIKGDSDLVIAGNVTIQRVLGREPQFESQDEFDALMDSDEDFIL